MSEFFVRNVQMQKLQEKVHTHTHTFTHTYIHTHDPIYSSLMYKLFLYVYLVFFSPLTPTPPLTPFYFTNLFSIAVFISFNRISVFNNLP